MDRTCVVAFYYLRRAKPPLRFPTAPTPTALLSIASTLEFRSEVKLRRGTCSLRIQVDDDVRVESTALQTELFPQEKYESKISTRTRSTRRTPTLHSDLLGRGRDGSIGQ